MLYLRYKLIKNNMAELNTYRIILPNGIEIELKAFYYNICDDGFRFRNNIDDQIEGSTFIPAGSAIIKL